MIRNNPQRKTFVGHFLMSLLFVAATVATFERLTINDKSEHKVHFPQTIPHNIFS